MGSFLSRAVVFAKSGLFWLVLALVLPLGAAEPVEAVKVLSVEGTVEILKAGTWIPAKAGQVLETGHHLRTGPKSRALVLVSKLDSVRLGELVEYQLRAPVTPGAPPIFELKAGSAYFFGRERPRALGIRTKVVSGAIRGTEFQISVEPDGRTLLTMIDGEVELESAKGQAVATRNDSVEISSTGTMVKSRVINAMNLVQWSLYYPAVLDPEEIGFSPAEKSRITVSLDHLYSGNIPASLQFYPTNRQPGSPSERIYYAGLLLSVGLVEQCEAQLAAAGSDDEKTKRLIKAVRQLIAAVKFQTSEDSTKPELASEFLAQSYYQQSRGNLKEALLLARQAVAKSPSWGGAYARVAELEFSFGNRDQALIALQKSLGLAPQSSKALSLKGFLQAAENRTDEAISSFDQAIGLDSAFGEAWLGRGLCKIRQGEGEEGRSNIETAAALEPNRAVIRSYLGKAFAEIRDDPRAVHELQLAKSFDPDDPTGPLYLALLYQRQNRLNEGIRELENSQKLGGNRRVYRSSLLLDADSAVRGVNLANLYRDAGLEDVSVREASRAVNFDYANYSTHLFLANSYNQLRDPGQVNVRYETPWLSEYLLANLLSPVGAGTLSQTVSQMEYSKMFERDGVGLASMTEYRSRGDWMEAGAQYGNFGKIAYSIDTVYRSQTGTRANNDQEQRTHSAQFKAQLTPDDTLYFQAVLYDANGGDLAQYFNPNDARKNLRIRERQEPLLMAGYRHSWSPNSHTLFLAGRFMDEQRVTDSSQPLLLLARNNGQVVAAPVTALPTASLDYSSSLELYSAEIQQIWSVEKQSVIVGARAQTGTFDSEAALGRSTTATLGSVNSTIPIGFSTPPFKGGGETEIDRLGIYGYYFWRIVEPLQLNAGLSYDYLNYPANFRSPPLSARQESRDQVSPKAGFTWTPLQNTAVRFAYTRSLGGVSFDQSVRLEPGQVAGFNQAFRSLIPESEGGSISGAAFETFGLALDQKFKGGTYLGIEAGLMKSDATRSIGTIDLNFPGFFSPSTTRQELEYEEQNLSIHIHQLLGNEWSVGSRYQVSRALLDLVYPEIPSSVSDGNQSHNKAVLHQAGLFLNYNHRSGLFARTEGWWFSQSNSGYSTGLPGDDFFQFNIFGGYRFLQRRAELQMGVLNLGGNDYRLNPLNLHHELPRERTFVARLQFSF